MSGTPAQVLAERLANSLQRAVAFNEDRDAVATREALVQAETWLDRLREAL